MKNIYLILLSLIAGIQFVSAQTPAITAPPNSQTVYAGGGVSFQVAATNNNSGLPLYYFWQRNGVNLTNSSRISGADTNVLTITGTITNDAGAYSCIVSNSAGMDNSTNHGTATLTVNPTPASLLYAETFPTYEVPVGFYPIGTVGWISPSTLGVYSGGRQTSPAYFYSAGAGTTEFYTTTASDTGVSGLPFPSIDLAVNSNLVLSAIIQTTTNTTTARVIVQITSNGATNWFISTTNLPLVPNSSTNCNQAFAPGAAHWNTFDITNMTVGGTAASDLTGFLTGAGVFLNFPNGENGSISFFSIIVPNAPVIDVPPNNQTVYIGGGVSFQVHVASGTPPYSYFWQHNGVNLTNSSRISGADGNVLTILNAGTNDAGQYSCIVSNASGADNSTNHGTATLTVNPMPTGLLYAETFPTPEVPAGTGFYPVSTVGWDSIGGAARGLWSSANGTSPAYFYSVGAGTSDFYATTASDTGVSGLPFPSIDLASNTSLTLSATINVTTNATTASFIVQINSNNWFVSTANLPLVANSSTNCTQAFAPGATNWNTFNVTSMTVGAPAASDLAGSLTGAGVFLNFPKGENGNISYFGINRSTATDLGRISVGPGSGNSLILNWTAGATVHLQNTTNLTPPVIWSDMTNTAGQGSVTITTTNTQMFFRLIQ